MLSDDIIYFWFVEAGSESWWQKDKEFDAMVKRRFLSVYQKAVTGELAPWRERAIGRLAEILILDQFPRNMFRDTPKASESDPVALVLAQEAVRLGVDRQLAPIMRAFLYMPYMHSENRLIQALSVELYSRSPELKNSLEFAVAHKSIIDRFGRYPHRNQILGRQTTPEEIEFLKRPNSSF